MSEMTIIQLIAAQRERELQEQGKPGTCAWFELPALCILCMCILLFVSVATIATVISGFFRGPNNQMPYDTSGIE
jgi:hypothetical protein